jgi:tetratricopeptide (TPR) repeat protein
MSLLNDALRKKSREIQKTESVEDLRTQPAARQSKRAKLALAAGLLLLCGSLTLGAWYLRESLPGQVDARIAPKVALQDLDLQKSNPASDPQVDLQEKGEPASIAPQSITKIAPPLGLPEQAPAQSDQEGLKDTSEEKFQPATSTVGKKPRQAPKIDVQKIATEKAPSSNSHEKSLFFQKALRYHQQGQLHQAIQMYKQVLSVDPDYPEALLNLGAAYIQVAAFADAYPLLKHLREIDRTNPDVLVNLAIVEIGLGKATEAIDLLHLAASRYAEPQFGICFHHAAALSQLDKLEEARAFYKKAEELNPHHSSLIFNLAVLADKLQRYDEAVQYYRRFLQQSDQLPLDEKNKIEARIRSLRAYPAGKPNPTELRVDG